MSSREDLGKSLLECLREVAALLEHAYSVALNQQDALVKNDAEAIVLSAKAQEEVLRRIGESDQRAGAIAGELAETAGLEPAEADSESVARAAGYPYTELLRREMSRISKLAETVQRENEVSVHLLGNGLDIIACCLKTVASDPGPNAYGNRANFTEPHAVVLSLDKKV